MLGLVRGTLALHDHEAMWDENAAQTVVFLKKSFGQHAVDIQHIGSTAIRYIKAKPIIDLMAGVKNMADVTGIVPILEKVGIIYLPKNDRPDYMMFIMGDLPSQLRTHHIHVVPHGGKEWNDYLNFRDFMNAHSEKAKEYEALKVNSSILYHDNRGMYTASKEDYIQDILKQAAAWRRRMV